MELESPIGIMGCGEVSMGEISAVIAYIILFVFFVLFALAMEVLFYGTIAYVILSVIKWFGLIHLMGMV